MPTVEADVAFGLGKFHLSQDEVRSRVLNALKSVGMADYSHVGTQRFQLTPSLPSFLSLFLPPITLNKQLFGLEAQAARTKNNSC